MDYNTFPLCFPGEEDLRHAQPDALFDRRCWSTASHPQEHQVGHRPGSRHGHLPLHHRQEQGVLHDHRGQVSTRKRCHKMYLIRVAFNINYIDWPSYDLKRGNMLGKSSASWAQWSWLSHPSAGRSTTASQWQQRISNWRRTHSALAHDSPEKDKNLFTTLICPKN